ncbi:hypothetical protein [Brevundimonas sp.]|uniref:hypothetical protein n=1 Tax=Brevundimonas sp. TaxID=1871086 RepID=UPI0028A20483|nr:hypothetical protein [Brevundimonas sp.]
MTEPTLEQRRAERLAAIAAARKGDAELDLPVLADLKAAASQIAAMAEVAAGLAAQLIQTTASNGMPLAQQVANADASAKNLTMVVQALIADAVKAQADG